MGQAERMIGVYHEAAVVCGVLAVCFLAVAMVLFFLFRIPGTLDFLSGNMARRSIKRMKREAKMEQEAREEREARWKENRKGDFDRTTIFLGRTREKRR